jgi:hypothetical protein
VLQQSAIALASPAEPKCWRAVPAMDSFILFPPCWQTDRDLPARRISRARDYARGRLRKFLDW